MRTPRLLLPVFLLCLSAVACQQEEEIRVGVSSGSTASSETPAPDGDGAPATGEAQQLVDGHEVTSADCWVTFTFVGEGATQEWQGALSGEAAYVVDRADWGSSGGGMSVLNAGPDMVRTDDVRALTLTDQEPRFAQVTFGPVDEGTTLTLGELGTFQVPGGARLNVGPDVPFDVGGTLEFTITRSEFQQTDGGPKYIDALAGTFRNVGPLVFDNPFPENGKRGEVTDLHGAFNIDRRGCTIL